MAILEVLWSSKDLLCFAKKVHHHEANCLFIERVQFTFKKSGVKLTPRSNPTCNFISPRRTPKKTNEQKLAAPKNPCCSFAEMIFLQCFTNKREIKQQKQTELSLSIFTNYKDSKCCFWSRQNENERQGHKCNNYCSFEQD